MITMRDNAVNCELGPFAADDWRLGVEVDGVLLHVSDGNLDCVQEGGDLSLTVEFADKSLRWEIRFTSTADSIVVNSEFFNTGTCPVTLGKVYLLDAQHVTFGRPGDSSVVLPWSIWGELQVCRMDEPNLPKLAKIKAQFYNQTTQKALQVGFLSFQRANTEVLYDYDADSGWYSMKAYCDFAGWQLQPGQSTASEEFRVMAGDNPLAQMRDWADEVSRRVKPNIREEAPLGYIGWAWVDCVNGQESYEQVTMGNLDAINERLGGFGVKYLWTSMANVDGSLPGNWLKWNDRCIPSGREEFIKNVKDKGFLPGFWVGPFYLCSMLKDMMAEFEDAILQNPDGTPMVVCQEWRHGDAGLLDTKDRPCLYALDPSHPKVLNFIRNVFQTYEKWGVRYYMVDFLEAGAGNIHKFPYKEHYDKSMVAGPEAYTNFLREMKKAAGPEAYLLSATGPTLHHAGILDAVRTGNDFGEGRALSKESFFFPAMYVINQPHFWTGPAWAVNNQAANFHTHRKLYINDSGNVLTVDQPIPLSHAQMHATIHAFSGSQTMLGDDIRQISDQRLALIKKTLPRNRETGLPVDLFDSPQPVGARMFLRKIKTDWGQYDVLALYNMKPQATDITVDLTRLGLDADKDYLVWDFWDESFVGKVRGEVAVHLLRESTRVLRFVEDTSQPVLVGSDMHVMMGEMEITQCEYDPASMTFRVEATRPAGEKGMLFVHAPENVYIKNFDGLHIAKDGRDNTLIIGIPMVFGEDKRVTREIQFDKLSTVLEMKQEDIA